MCLGIIIIALDGVGHYRIGPPHRGT